MIKAINIHKSYDKVEVLKGIDLEISKSEIVTIMGASGAGKTTLLQIIGTLDKADKGEIIFNGNNINNLNDKRISQFRNKHIGFIFQFHHLLPEFNTIENVCLPAFIAKTPKKLAIERAEELLEYLNMSERKLHKPSELSGGEQQRVAVARALINSPDIILADEPSGNLDSNNARELHNLFFKLREKFNQTFLIVTHNQELANMSDRTFFMKDGKIIK
jgi:lipoprotein-releasing system ATP-binding protein